MAITATDIAKRVGVSQGTVSSVLTGKGTQARIAKATQEKILAMAKALHYRPSFAGQALVRGQTRSIGFLCGDICNPHFNELADLAMHEVEKLGFHLVLAVAKWHTAKNDLEAFDSLLARGVDGVIYFGSAMGKGTAQYAQIIGEKFPFVSITHAIEGLPSIVPDNAPGINEAVAHFKENGHRRLAYFGTSQSTKEVPLARAAKRHGLSLSRHYVTVPPGQWARVSHFARAAAHQFADLRERPTAVFVSSDHLAGAFSCGLWDRGLRIPDDVSVIGYDGTRAGGMMTPPLTSVDAGAETIIRRAVEAVHAQLENRGAADTGMIAVPTRLVVRESVSTPARCGAAHKPEKEGRHP
ncbi:MAG: LacI family DNA-binding transcriptional regulator [Lentisphaeria bacterium]